MITGKHLINGQWHTGPSSFQSHDYHGSGYEIQNASTELVNQAACAALTSFQSYSKTDTATRAKFLRTIAEQINLRSTAINEVCELETGLPKARLEGERGRTTTQLEMFADYIEDEAYLQKSVDEALPERKPIPRPELKKMMQPYGPVAVFGASNFPLAFSTAGGDTASALAAGCPVVVKGHPAHPATSEIIAQAILDAINICDLDAGVFSLIQDSGITAAQELVTHSAITAVGFTGSLQAGRALYDLCSQRHVPIPFYGEMGSLNPVFISSNALMNRCDNIASEWVGSLNLGVGQFCTKPGVLILPETEQSDRFIEIVKDHLSTINASKLLTQGIVSAYTNGINSFKEEHDLDVVYFEESHSSEVSPCVFSTSADNWLNNQSLQREIFGPFAVIIKANDQNQMIEIANQLEGQLTATLFIEPGDYESAASLCHVLAQKAGRVLANGFPTGVEVAESMVHGGPYPASTFVGSTSVGATAIQRFIRPVCYQNMPNELLPPELKTS